MILNKETMEGLFRVLEFLNEEDSELIKLVASIVVTRGGAELDEIKQRERIQDDPV